MTPAGTIHRVIVTRVIFEDARRNGSLDLPELDALVQLSDSAGVGVNRERDLAGERWCFWVELDPWQEAACRGVLL